MTTAPQPVSDTNAMIAGMTPEAQPGRFVFCSLNDAAANEALLLAQATFREPEGVSVLMSVENAERLKLPVAHVMAQITLKVYSALDGVGLTAAVAARLTAHDIPCNVIAAHHHDHIFVPEGQADAALEALRALQQEAAGAN